MSDAQTVQAPRVSVIVPCYNAIDKIGRCLGSLRRMTMAAADHEVIFVDDQSRDGTYALLAQECARHPNWHLLRLEVNSGSPSEPRNRGIAAARGDYVFFLDCDDEILPDTLAVHYAHALATEADIVRGYLLSETDGVTRVFNQLPDWNPDWSRVERIRAILAHQSTVNSSLIRTALLRQTGITWPHAIRMGEDTMFLISVLGASARIEYVDHPTFIYLRNPGLTPSSTQSYGDRELRDHLTVWDHAIQTLAPEINYVTLRLQVGLQTALLALIHVNRGDVSRESFRTFSDFVTRHRAGIEDFRLAPRLKEILQSLWRGDWEAFCRLCRPRLLIAGTDLKFITGARAELERYFDIRLDEWGGHTRHDAAQSQDCLAWAELIWCEWLLGNALWYAEHKSPRQKLIIRMHRFELGREFGDQLDMEKVGAVVAVSAFFFERLLERFAHLPRHKARLLPNYIDAGAYRQSQDPERRFHLAMIGILPTRKRFDLAIRVLQELRRHDPRYRLSIYGKAPGDLAWLARDAEAMAYYRACDLLIRQSGLEEVVHMRGHVDIATALAEDGVGIVLSMSDSERAFPCGESFHLAVADGFSAGGVGLMKAWDGAEYIWPERFILPDEESLIARIRFYGEHPDVFEQDAVAGLRFVKERYGLPEFAQAIRSLYQQLA